MSAVMKGLNSLIPPPAIFSPAQPQHLTQPRPSLPDKFEDINSKSSHSQGAVVTTV